MYFKCPKGYQKARSIAMYSQSNPIYSKSLQIFPWISSVKVIQEGAKYSYVFQVPKITPYNPSFPKNTHVFQVSQVILEGPKYSQLSQSNPMYSKFPQVFPCIPSVPSNSCPTYSYVFQVSPSISMYSKCCKYPNVFQVSQSIPRYSKCCKYPNVFQVSQSIPMYSKCRKYPNIFQVSPSIPIYSKGCKYPNKFQVSESIPMNF